MGFFQLSAWTSLLTQKKPSINKSLLTEPLQHMNLTLNFTDMGHSLYGIIITMITTIIITVR